MTQFKRDKKGNLKTQIGNDGKEYLIPCIIKKEVE